VKHCPRCNTEQPEERFGRRSRDGKPQSWCKTCMASYMREHRKKHREVLEVARALAVKLITPSARFSLIDQLIWNGKVRIQIAVRKRETHDGEKTVSSHD
jgi:hypothetical protein